MAFSVCPQREALVVHISDQIKSPWVCATGFMCTSLGESFCYGGMTVLDLWKVQSSPSFHDLNSCPDMAGDIAVDSQS